MNIENKSVNQTPVEWQFEQLFNSFEKFNNGEFTFNDYLKRNLEIRKQALKMEENMVCDSWDDGYGKGLRTREEKIIDPVFNSKHYYDTKFKSE
jgi:hypothetical protein